MRMISTEIIAGRSGREFIAPGNFGTASTTIMNGRKTNSTDGVIARGVKDDFNINMKGGDDSIALVDIVIDGRLEVRTNSGDDDVDRQFLRSNVKRRLILTLETTS